MSVSSATCCVAKRELTSYFASPVAYVFIVIFLALTGFFTFMVGDFFARNQADLQPFFFWHPWLYLFLVPAIGMRLWSEERRSGSIELLLTLPLTDWQAIIGKFVAAWAFLGLALALTFPAVITVAFLGDPDGGAIFSGYIGSFLVAGVYLSVCNLASSFTRSQSVSFILGVVGCLLLVLSGWRPVTRIFAGWMPTWFIDGLQAFSIIPHYESLQRGVVDLRDIVYCLSVVAFCLYATGVSLKSKR